MAARLNSKQQEVIRASLMKALADAELEPMVSSWWNPELCITVGSGSYITGTITVELDRSVRVASSVHSCELDGSMFIGPGFVGMMISHVIEQLEMLSGT